MWKLVKLAGRGFKNIQNVCCFVFRADSDIRQPSGLDVTQFGPGLAEGSGVWTSWLDLGRFGLALARGSGVAEAVSEGLLLRPGA